MWPELVELVRLETADFLGLQWKAVAIFALLSWSEGSLVWLHSRGWSLSWFRTTQRSAKPTPELINDLIYWIVTPTVRVLARFTLLFVLVGVCLLFGRRSPEQLGP